MNRLEEINKRLEEIRGMLEDDEKRGDTKFSDLEKEVRELKEEKVEIEAKQRMLDDEEEKEDRTLIEQAHQGGEEIRTIQPNDEQREAFQKYLETREIDGGALKTDSGFVVIPEQVVTEIMKLKEMEFNLDQYVTVKSVGYGSGKYPVIRQSEVAALPEVAELEENPKLAVKPFYNLGYDIKTYRGYFLVSREAIEDAAVNVLAELMTWMARTIASTRNAAIVKAIKEGTPGEEGKTLKLQTIQASGIDGIKDAVNLNLKPNYEHNVAIVSQTAFAELDKMKDNEGNYLLQKDVKEPTQKRLLGAQVVVLPDEMLGEKPGKTIIIGNLKDAIVLFDRSQYQAAWINYMQYGEALMVAVRQDVRILDEKSAIVIDFGGGAGVEG
ncbi:phage major capsid protein [Virgibacillus pantothenticus]|uniref:Capsid protein n=1 Tax=Virgibacillus pantothenticus TaxID=1473 RepID=A0A0L0QKL7_VIRPA|nr:phage major capsid protein [Virgibacillus pantothenticus]KNE19044.1 capsid protein [Virgibacillus pantothenticus]MED3738975.1 phage major capsid protein [Virgibacillus pantothenticus]QTY15485.1 phage major capsid protein [Virgibacillus pantothenticus]SIT16576.1 phage major capsid protein, HK97 family [Virgibacillus pantothenticus]